MFVPGEKGVAGNETLPATLVRGAVEAAAFTTPHSRPKLRVNGWREPQQSSNNPDFAARSGQAAKLAGLWSTLSHSAFSIGRRQAGACRQECFPPRSAR